jgi:hypothetical protein
LLRFVFLGDALNDDDARVAVTMPTRLMPPMISLTVIIRPIPVTDAGRHTRQ